MELRAWPPVHPRVRGERSMRSTSSMSRIGSSPRARGTAGPPVGRRRVQRFIPACAGNGSPPGPSSAPGTVHPRVRGERSSESQRTTMNSGSSPRARGTAPQEPQMEPERRFIPACAGNGRPRPCPAPPRPVHPRVRGERSAGAAGFAAVSGSSPRARGTGVQVEHQVGDARFIPACAGNGACAPAPASSSAVHPRVRGERSRLTANCSWITGSSPRARGTGPGPPAGGRITRFIPACAGNGLRPR